MILGHLFVGVKGSTVTAYSPWFPRHGNLAVISCQVFAFDNITGTGSGFKVGVETKNSEQSDKDVTTPNNGSVNAITLTALASTTWQVGANLSSASAGFLELVRFKYTLFTPPAGGDEPWVHFRMLEPSWLTN